MINLGLRPPCPGENVTRAIRGRVGGWCGRVVRREVSQHFSSGFPQRVASLRDHGGVLRFQPPVARNLRRYLGAATAPQTRYQLAGAGPAVTVPATADEDLLARTLVA
jgi:hypothetical protein